VNMPPVADEAVSRGRQAGHSSARLANGIPSRGGHCMLLMPRAVGHVQVSHQVIEGTPSTVRLVA
jgi:hypothetical protein